MSNKYKVGDVVRIKKNLLSGVDCAGCYDSCFVASEMLSYEGRTAIIMEARRKNRYSINLDHGFFCWTDEMFEPVEERDKTTAEFTRKDLQTCMFGETNDGSIFVVAGNLLV